ncbi:hypothetical protein [Pedobacter frigidisoli]|uniref:hypothetical protein n=1 Tax=Pedobacter frigidisoli TaxID=2530455 RepID=UPI00293164D4|nr:hypothetical protein [Pedobacter frigidisoli]
MLTNACLIGWLPKHATKIRSLLGEFADVRGFRLVSEIVSSIDPKGLIIDTEQLIGPKYQLKHHEDIGDIDLLVIDPAGRIVYSLESTSISPSRNVKEMIEEMAKLV